MQTRKRNPLIIVGALAIAGLFVAAWFAGYLQPGDFASRERAKMVVMAAEKATRLFQIQHGRLPATLDELTKPGPDGERQLLEVQALVDPWGQRLHYDPDQLHPENKKPAIWSEGPPGENRPIRNWGE